MIPIYFINLKRSQQRHKFMKSQLQRFEHKRIEAIDYLNEHNIIKYDSNNKTEKKFLACLSSHLYAIKTAYDDNLNEVIISEDDIDLQSIYFLIYDKLDCFLKQTCDDCHVIQLHSCKTPLYKNTIIKHQELSLQKKKLQYWGCTFYYIKRKGMEQIMSMYKNDVFDLTPFKTYPLLSDVIIYSICKTKILNVPCVNIVNPTTNESTLQTERNLKYIQHPGFSFVNSFKNIFINKFLDYDTKDNTSNMENKDTTTKSDES